MICAVCKNSIGEDEPSTHHSRLNVDVHYDCPWDNVLGEDIRFHTMMFRDLDKIANVRARTA